MTTPTERAAEVLAGVANRRIQQPGTAGHDRLSQGRDVPLAEATDWMDAARALADAGLLPSHEEWGWCDDVTADPTPHLVTQCSSRERAEKAVALDPAARVLVRRYVGVTEWAEVTR